jgi:hypothetical protein
MTFGRKSVVLAQTATFLAEVTHPLVDTSELDSYLFDREARMDEVWASEHASTARQGA